jgi:Rne/Rng family ribonuclease
MNELLISVSKPGWFQLAVLRGGRLDLMEVEPFSASEVGTIFKGRVDVVEPSPQIQAAFLSLGLPKRGFLHVSDVVPALYAHLGRRPAGKDKPPIETIFRPGQEVDVQIIKEGVPPKGPMLSTYICLASRYLVFMPSLERSGVLRKMEDVEQRKQILAVLGRITPPGMGFIARDASLGRTEAELRHHLDWLVGTWRFISERLASLRAPAVAFGELGAVYAALVERLSSDIDVLWLDDRGAYEQVRGLLAHVYPGREGCVRLHEGAEPLFTAFGLPDETVEGEGN